MTNGTLTALEIKPGFQKNNTPYSSEAEWIDGDKVRFKYRYPEKLGGWLQRVTTSVIGGVPRDIYAWADLVGERILAVGSNTQLALLFSGSDYLDITPTDFTPGLADNNALFGFGSGPWGGDFVPLADISANTDVTSLVDSSVTISGVTSADLGYGESPTSVSTNFLSLSQWSLDNFGEDLIACNRGSFIFRWDRSSVETTVISSVTTDRIARAVPISGAPIEVNQIIIAEPQPYLVAFGTCTQTGPFDPLLIRWADLQDFSQWKASTQNTAGDYRIQGGSEIIAVTKTKRETLVHTDDVVYSMQLVGGDSIFDFERLAANAGVISQHCTAEANSFVYWMGPSSFFIYDGRVRPIETPLDEALFDRTRSTSLNFSQKEKVYAGVNSEFNEIWWLYPSRDSVENDRYIIYNFIEDLWYDGTINRSVWLDADVFELPIAAFGTSASGAILYDHENGFNDGTSIMTSWAKTGVFDIEDGDKVMFVNRFVPDFTNLVGTMDLTMIGKKFPLSSEVKKGPYTINNQTQKLDFRFRARQMQFSVSSSTFDGNWELGTQRINIRPDGER